MGTILRTQQPSKNTAPTNVANTQELSSVSKLLVRLKPGPIALILSAVVFVLTLFHVGSLLLYYSIPDRSIPKILFRLFDLGQDSNLPTLFSAFILLCASGLLFFLFKISKAKAEHFAKKRWFLLSLIFLFLCVDEGAMIHDVTVDSVRNMFSGKVPDFLWISWVIPYFVFTMAVVLYYAKFMWILPPKTRNLILLSGFMFVLGAMGFEMLESIALVNANQQELAQGIKPGWVHQLETVEEVIEMESIILFIYALLDYIKAQKTEVVINPGMPELA